MKKILYLILILVFPFLCFGSIPRPFSLLSKRTVNSGNFNGPADYSPFIWIAADYSLTNDSGNAVSANDSVKTFGDKSGNQNVLSHTSDLNFAVYKVNQQNGLPAVDFTGHNTWYEIAALAQGSKNQPITIYFVARYSSSGIQKIGFSSYRDLNIALDGLDTDHACIYAGSCITSSGVISDGWHVFTCIFDGVNSILRIDGVQVASGDLGSGSLVGFTIGGYQPSSDLHWRDLFGECIGYLEHHNNTKITNMEGWFRSATRWNF